jgi:hypothetical protein
MDALEFWCSDEEVISKNCIEQFDVFMYDADEATYCCSATPNYALDPLYGSFRLDVESERDPEHAGQDEELVESIKEMIGKYLRKDIMYKACAEIDRLPHYPRAEIPDKLPKEFVIVWDDGPFDDPDYETMDSFMADVEGDFPL